MSSIEVGQIVPDFTLQAGGGKRVSLKQFRGRKVVIYFYPKDMTPTCTEESCHFRDYNDQFRQLNVEVIGISPDDPKSHEKFAAKHELPFFCCFPIRIMRYVSSSGYGPLRKCTAKNTWGLNDPRS